MGLYVNTAVLCAYKGYKWPISRTVCEVARGKQEEQRPQRLSQGGPTPISGRAQGFAHLQLASMPVDHGSPDEMAWYQRVPLYKHSTGNERFRVYLKE